MSSQAYCDMSVKRFYYLDFLKTVGLLLIILAHASPPAWLFAIRTFDVPMMVILSGMLGKIAYERHISNKHGTGLEYILRRCKRIVLPTWVFCFGVFIPISLLVGNHYSLKQFVDILFFQPSGMGYIWIAMVYVLCAMVVPFIYHQEENKRRTLVLAVFVYAIYEILVTREVGIENKFMSTIPYQLVPYGILTMAGMYTTVEARRSKIMLAVLSGLVVTIYAIYGIINGQGIISPQEAKYPARLYYLSYGVFVTMILLLITEKKDRKVFHSRLVLCISKSSYWIYLWHIILVASVQKLFPSMIWIIRYFIVVICSVGMAVIQQKCINVLRKHANVPNEVLSIFEG